MGRNMIEENMTSGIKRILHALLTALLSFALFFLVYRIFMNSERTYWKIWMVLSLTGLISSLTARALLKYWDHSVKPLKEYLQNLLIPAIYAVVVFAGGIDYLFDAVQSGEMKYSTFLIIFYTIKLFVYLLADYLSDKMTFEGL